MAKVIPLHKVIKASTSPLTTLMIKTLKAACAKQKNNEPFGQEDLDGSFMALLKREFIDCNTSKLPGVEKVIWFVTPAGIKALEKAGIKDAC